MAKIISTPNIWTVVHMQKKEKEEINTHNFQ